jgi:tetratricopeptide (TPR) repeat protein
MSKPLEVKVWTDQVIIPTYLPHVPDKNPMFLEKRVYQGSKGKVYPLPFTDRVAEKPVERNWKVIWLENQFLSVMILPEIGGRIHAIRDKSNGYDLIYNQSVIKPALVGLAGPWISGGIEFNWPQHHRPATFLPVETHIERHADGASTVWCSDHDPMARMKGMHGVCLHPDRTYLELKVRAYNRTPFIQTFLWWANVATRVHEGYQSFFPPDVYYVADHAKRAMSEYPRCRGFYYGVNFGKRGRRGIPQEDRPTAFIPPHALDKSSKKPARRGDGKLPEYAANDLSWYANIPTPCSYMCMGSQQDFFGGYDHFQQAGIVHIANHHISPGKKQWTWGNHEFGYAWDRNLTDKDDRNEYGPYIEIMAGVYTDNQPDFSFLQPGETKAWSQYWYPIRRIGPVQQANLDAALSLRCSSDHTTAIVIGVAVTREFPDARIVLSANGKNLFSFTQVLAPGAPLVKEIKHRRCLAASELLLRVLDHRGNEIISYQPRERGKTEVPPAATEPAAPSDMASADELFMTGLHLEQYRHATRCPTPYWREALRRDPLDARCNNAMGLWHLRRGEFAQAEGSFRRALERLTRRNSNPRDGEVCYNLGLCLRYLGRDAEAYAAFYKAVWNQAWMAGGYHALAEIDCTLGHWGTALDHLNSSLRLNTDNTRARNLKAMVLRKLGRVHDAKALLRDTVALDPLDWWARCLVGESLTCDLQTQLDLAHDQARAGFYREAIALLEHAQPAKRDLPDQSWGALPMVQYTLGWLHEKCGARQAAVPHYRAAAQQSSDYCFPARLEEIAILETAMRANPRDARAPYYLANLLYDRRRQQEAIKLWERSVRLDPDFSVVWRNLGIGYFNIGHNPRKARTAYDRAFRVNRSDARLVFERDQLWKRLGEAPVKRLRELEKYPGLVRQRDDLSVEFCALLNQTGRHVEAMQLLSRRNFQPWEGGEGAALGQHVRTQLSLGREALAHQDWVCALNHFEHALTSPRNLGEAKHLLANQSDIQYWAGVACEQMGEKKKARQHWRAAARFQGDFQTMRICSFSEMTYYSALSWKRLGQKARAEKLLIGLLDYARKLPKTKARIDYFATSLPTMLLFDDDLQYRQETTALFLQAQAQLGFGNRSRGQALLTAVLTRDPNHALAMDLLADCGKGNNTHE